MSTIKEYREFFLRAVQVPTGTKADKETNYITEYQVTDVNGDKIMAFNRFLKDHFPSQDVFEKLFNSLTFKINPEDTASVTTQGLVKIVTGEQVIGRNDSVTTSGETFTTVIVPSALPVVAAGTNTTVTTEIIAPDGSVVGSVPVGTADIYYLRYKVNAISGKYPYTYPASSFSGSVLTVTAATHGQGLYPAVQVYNNTTGVQLVAGSTMTSVTVESNGDVKIDTGTALEVRVIIT